TLNVFERPAADADPLAFTDVGVRHGVQAAVEDFFYSFAFLFGHRRQSIPALDENAHQSARFADLVVALFVDPPAEKKITAKQRHLSQTPQAAAARPDVYLRQEHLEIFGL